MSKKSETGRGNFLVTKVYGIFGKVVRHIWCILSAKKEVLMLNVFMVSQKKLINFLDILTSLHFLTPETDFTRITRACSSTSTNLQQHPESISAAPESSNKLLG